MHLSVIKYGGHAMDHPDLAAAFAHDIARLSRDNERFVLVHGGGPHISALIKRLALESHFIDGLRVTDAQTLEAVEMVLAGTVNKAVVATLAQAGVKAVGISGRDGDLLNASIRDPALGRVGTITRVNPSLLTDLLAKNWVPVVAPLANDESYAALNVNADTAAGAIAGSLNAKRCIFISDVPGVLDAHNTCCARLTRADIRTLTEEGVITGGMIPKVAAATDALAQGAGAAVILDGREQNNLYACVRGEAFAGTVIVP